ncbi:MAG: ATP-binding protein [Verrucomicrobiota bacterium]|jgi:ATP-dependent DNA helicase RecG
MTDQELETLLKDPESEVVERKESLAGDARDTIRQAICAFANDLPNHRKPGVVFVGAGDDGSCAGLSITDQVLLTLADMKTDGNILPIPTMSVERRKLAGYEVAVVTVQPSDAPPVQYRGRIWVRTGPRRSIASAQDERILNEKRRHRDLPFDLHPIAHARLDDLNRRLFEEEYLPSAVAADILERNVRSYEQRLAACRLVQSVDAPVPTVTGCLVLATLARDLVPCDYIQFLRIDGTTLTDSIKDAEDVDGPLGQIISRLDQKMEAHIQTAVEVTSGPVEVRKPDYPLVALQQLARNAVMHRTYESTNAPVRITWFNDRIEIQNPGGPFGQVTKQNFGEPGVVDYRNPHLAEAMKVLGYVQRFGVGIQLAQESLRRNGNPPAKFTVEDTFVHVEIKRTL